MTREEIIQAIHRERDRQEKLHPNWDGSEALAILLEECGEVGRAEYESNRATSIKEYKSWRENFEFELIQVAAVCFRILENRGGDCE